ncbi:MAG TPA: polysaccharide lyase family protein, partial [Nitrospira sp.]|nr:polysaccharide lyase family protein [Nitrospira sp.]
MRCNCRTRILTLGVLVSALAGVRPLAAVERTIWEIGKFDQSSFEFKGHGDLANPQYNPVFTVGKSDPTKDWPAEQPGSANKDAGGRPHPYTILFNLSEPPRGVYRLDVSVILSHSRVPALRLELNGKSGWFYFRRKASYYPGDFGVDSPIYGGDRVEIELPTRLFKSGENKLVLTAVDDPKEGEGDSWLAYDALRLVQDAAGKPPDRPQVSVDPTIFYTHQDGGLAEQADVTVTLDEPVRGGDVTLSVAGKQLRSSLAAEADFGQWRLELAIPELSGPTDAELTIRVNGKTHLSHLTLVPQRQWTAYVAPHAHLDIGFTDYQGKVAEIHNRNVDKLLDEIDARPEMRFSLDGSWIVRQYLASRNPQSRDRLLKFVRDGKIAVPAQLANLMTGYPTLEELIRSTAYSEQLHREQSIPFDYVNITDDPSYTWSYPSVLHALGIKYFLAASNNDRAPILLYGRWNEKSPFWWQGPDGNKVLMSYSRQYFQLSFVCGVPAQEGACEQSLPAFFQQYESPSYKPDAVLMYGSQIENTDLIPGEPEFVQRWNSKYAYPRMVLATFPDYMRYIEQHYGSELPTVVGDGGPYWEDGYGTDAHYLAIDRSSQQRAPSAEKLSTIATFLHPAVSGPAGQVRRMWDDLVLYAEHTFTSWGGYSRPDSE